MLRLVAEHTRARSRSCKKICWITRRLVLLSPESSQSFGRRKQVLGGDGCAVTKEGVRHKWVLLAHESVSVFVTRREEAVGDAVVHLRLHLSKVLDKNIKLAMTASPFTTVEGTIVSWKESAALSWVKSGTGTIAARRVDFRDEQTGKIARCERRRRRENVAYLHSVVEASCFVAGSFVRIGLVKLFCRVSSEAHC